VIERLGDRTYTRKVFDREDGKRVSHFHLGHIHYRPTPGAALEEVNLQWEDMGTHWRMVQASYRVFVAKDFAAADLIRFDSRFEGADQTVFYEPRALVWATGRNMGNVQPFRTHQAVTGALTGDTIRYTDAFGAGLHVEVSLRRSGISKELVIDSQAAVGAPPTANHRLVWMNRYRSTGVTGVLDTTGRTWNGNGTFDDAADNGFRLSGDAGPGIFVRPARAEDASGRYTRLPVVWASRDAALWQAKLIPNAVLTQATYPLRADTVTSFFAGAGDGYVEDASSASWDVVHDATSGTLADPTGTTLRVGVGFFNPGQFNIRRAFFPVDTSGLPDGDSISAATFYAKPSALTANADDDGDDWFVLVGPTTQASNTTLAVGDYDQCEAINTPQEITGSRHDYSTFSTSAYTSWALNATGLSIVSKTGYTLIGMREGHDVIDSQYNGPNNNSNQLRFHTSEATGTSNDPYLEVTHSSGVRRVPLLHINQAVNRASTF
jgi:hypothetical protein